jgi:hypothetical protein
MHFIEYNERLKVNGTTCIPEDHCQASQLTQAAMLSSLILVGLAAVSFCTGKEQINMVKRSHISHIHSTQEELVPTRLYDATNVMKNWYLPLPAWQYV